MDLIRWLDAPAPLWVLLVGLVFVAFLHASRVNRVLRFLGGGLETLEKDQSGLRMEIARIVAAQGSLRDQIRASHDSLGTKIDSVESAVESLGDRIDILELGEDELDALRADIESVESDAESLSGRIDLLERPSRDLPPKERLGDDDEDLDGDNRN